MAEILGFGEVAEWFKAAVLKTSAENIAHPRKTAKPAHFCGRQSRVPDPFAKNILSQESAQ